MPLITLFFNLYLLQISMINYLNFSHPAKRLFVFFFLISVFQVSVIAQKVSISKPQSWVKLQEPDLKYILPESDISGGYYYLLVDKQENISEKSIYSRYAVKITNSQGVQYMSDISAVFDPHYQKVIFNHLRIIRQGQIIDKLSMNAIKTIQRESEMDRFSYDGRLTAIINLTDVRQGDIIDYSYTVTGYNPAMKGQYASELYFEYTLPVHRIHLRLLVPENLKLNFNYAGEKYLPTVSKSADLNEYVWKLDNIKSTVYEDNTPAWYDPSSRVSVTSFKTWKDIVDLFLPDYQVKESDLSKLKPELNEILKSKEIDKQVVEAIRFVQDHIRYLGFESGISAYIPNSPGVVLKRRFGDCKDKSLLLCAILKTIGVEARPVLVNMSGLYDESMLQPSPLAFNHCIVQVFFNNDYWYVDPTLSSQGGVCGTFYVPQYGEGLVLREGTEGLTNIDKPGNTKILSRSTFIIDSIGGNAILKVFSKYEGGQADVNRAFFESSSIDDINRYYIDFYDEAYPKITVDGNPAFQDDRENNIFSVEEKYLIKDFWSPVTSNKEKISCSFYPLTLRSLLITGATTKRKMPLALQYPADVTEQIEIMLPQTWSASPSGFEVENKAYSYSYTALHAGLKINLEYKYRAKLKHVDASEAEEILTGFNKIENESSGYTLTYDTNLAKSFRFSWLMGVIALISIAVSIYFAIKIYKTYNLKTQADSFMSEDIGGWLVLVAIGLVVSPFVVFYGIFTTPEFFDKKTIEVIYNQDTHDSLSWAFIIVAELIYNMANLVFIGLLLVLFFTRRAILPRLIIIFYAQTFIFRVIDYYLANVYLDINYPDNDSLKSVFQSLFGAMIWIPYFLYSKRVKNTFVFETTPKSAFPDYNQENTVSDDELTQSASQPDENAVKVNDISEPDNVTVEEKSVTLE